MNGQRGCVGDCFSWIGNIWCWYCSHLCPAASKYPRLIFVLAKPDISRNLACYFVHLRLPGIQDIATLAMLGCCHGNYTGSSQPISNLSTTVKCAMALRCLELQIFSYNRLAFMKLGQHVFGSGVLNTDLLLKLCMPVSYKLHCVACKVYK